MTERYKGFNPTVEDGGDYEKEDYLATRNFHCETGFFRVNRQEYDKRWSYREVSVSEKMGKEFVLEFEAYQKAGQQSFSAEVSFGLKNLAERYRTDKPIVVKNTMALLFQLDLQTMAINAMLGTDFRFRTLPGMYDTEKKQEAEKLAREKEQRLYEQLNSVTESK